MYGALAKAGNTMPALGLCYLAAAARLDGHEVLIADAIARQLDSEALTREVVDFRPDLVGITATTIAIGTAARWSEGLRRQLPKVPIVVGGPHPTAVPEETLRRFPVFDAAAVGEGEATLRELLRDGLVESVAGLVFRRGGELVRTPARGFLADLDTLPAPAFDLLPGFPRAYRPPAHTFVQLPAATLVTSRGCPKRCTFCDRSVFGNRFRAHSAAYVLKLIGELCDRYGVRELIFYDDTFMVDPRRVEAICRGLLDAGRRLSWSCFGRVDFVNPDLLKLMRRAGCWQIGYGIESGHPEILKKMDKGADLETMKRALTWTRAAGIQSKGFFIIGNAGETEATIEATIRFALDSDLDDFQITNLTPFPGSAIYATAAREGAFEPDWEKMNMLKITFVPTGLTAELLERKQREAYRRFYLRPSVILRNLLRAVRHPAQLVRLWRGGWSLLTMLLARNHPPAGPAPQ